MVLSGGGAGLPDDAAAAAPVFEPRFQCLAPVPAWCPTPSGEPGDYAPDQAARELPAADGRCTRAEMPAAAAGLLSNRVADDSYTTTRKTRTSAHRAPGRPPVGTPTDPWLDAFTTNAESRPIEMRWVGVPERRWSSASRNRRVWGLVREQGTTQAHRRRPQRTGSAQCGGKTPTWASSLATVSFFVGIHAGGEVVYPGMPAGGQHVPNDDDQPGDGDDRLLAGSGEPPNLRDWRRVKYRGAASVRACAHAHQPGPAVGAGCLRSGTVDALRPIRGRPGTAAPTRPDAQLEGEPAGSAPISEMIACCTWAPRIPGIDAISSRRAQRHQLPDSARREHRITLGRSR